MKNKSHFTVDNTLRLLYRTLRLRGAFAVAIEFTHRGKRWRADSSEEAIRLREQLEKEDKQSVSEGAEEPEDLLYEQTKWTPDRFHDLVQNIGPMQKAFLGALVLSPNRFLEADTARKKIKMPSLLALAGVQSGLAKQVRNMGLEPSDLYQVKISWEEGERRRYFRIDEGFRLVALDYDWPPEHVRKELSK
jgi:hypothetical protein